jgi:hypothetical protein
LGGSYAEGNPYAIVETARVIRQYARIEVEAAIRESVGFPISRLHRTDPTLARFARIIAAASPPVEIRSLFEALKQGYTDDESVDPRKILDRGVVEEIFVVDEHHETVSFAHDLIEYDARNDERGSLEEFVVVAELLRHRVAVGGFHEIHVLSQYFAEATVDTHLERSINASLRVRSPTGSRLAVVWRCYTLLSRI